MATFRQCAGRELNPHALRHMALNHACLPIPAPARFLLEPRYYSSHTMNVNFLCGQRWRHLGKLHKVPSIS